jgi:hypothetical protein
LKRKHRGYGGTFYIDEVFVKINGKQHYRDLRVSAFNEWSRAVACGHTANLPRDMDYLADRTYKPIRIEYEPENYSFF